MLVNLKKTGKNIYNKTFFLDVAIELKKFPGQEAYFSLTGEYIEKKGFDSSGCIHKIILENYPELQIFADLHLSDEHGIPMHAAANAKYFGNNHDFCMLSKHLRVSVSKAKDLYDKAAIDGWEKIVDTLRDDWEKEAQNAIAMLRELRNHRDNISQMKEANSIG